KNLRVVFVLATVSCLIGLSWAAANATCPTPACDDAKNEVCENGYCKIKIDGTCTMDQTATSTATPSTSAVPTSASTGDTGKSSITTTTTEPTSKTADDATTAQSGGRKRRDATPAPMTNTQECVNNSLCTKAPGSTGLTCLCKDGYAKDDNGFCQEAKSSASSFRLGLLTSMMATLFYHSSC
ncbi:hypothetical protein MAR_012629, partial [Mya arenaria]